MACEIWTFVVKTYCWEIKVLCLKNPSVSNLSPKHFTTLIWYTEWGFFACVHYKQHPIQNKTTSGACNLISFQYKSLNNISSKNKTETIWETAYKTQDYYVRQTQPEKQTEIAGREDRRLAGKRQALYPIPASRLDGDKLGDKPRGRHGIPNKVDTLRKHWEPQQ